MKRIYIITLFVAMLFASGCRKEIPEFLSPEDQLITSWGPMFNSYWTGMNNNYMFWDVDSTDWDAVYEKYTPIFDTLALDESYTPVLLRQYFAEITSTLVDHHYTLSFSGGLPLKPLDPGTDEIKRRSYYHAPLTYEQFQTVRQTLGSRVSLFKEFADQEAYLHSYLLDDQIAYFRCDLFVLHQLANRFPEDVLAVLDNFYNLVHNTPNLKGVIIDTRSNGGGAKTDVDWCVGMLVSEKREYAQNRFKSGMGRLDYSPWIPMYVNPYKADGPPPPDVPIVSLVDVNSASLAEIVAMAISSLPRGIVIGERTVGATGGLLSMKSYYSGAFSNRFINVQTATMATRNHRGEILEGIGVTPDIVELYDKASFDRGVDNQLERVVRYINSGK